MKVIHPFDPKREDEKQYARRLEANKTRTALAFEPGDMKAIDAAIVVEKVSHEPGKHHEFANVDGAAELQKEIEKAKKLREKEEAEEAAAAKKAAEALEAKKAEDEEAEKVAARIADMKAKQHEMQKQKEMEAQRQASFEKESININKIGFMPLKKLLIERGVVKEQVFGAPSKFALMEVAKQWADQAKIDFVTDDPPADVS